MKLSDNPKKKPNVGYMVKTPGVDDNVGIFTIVQKVDRGLCDNEGMWQGFKNLDPATPTKQGSEVVEYEWGGGDGFVYFSSFWYGTIGGIHYSEWRSDLEEELIKEEPTINFRTLPEIMRGIMEWADHPGDDRIQVVCRSMVSEMEIPDDVREWVFDETPKQKVKGRPKSHKRGKVPDMKRSERFDEFCAWLAGTSRGA